MGDKLRVRPGVHYALIAEGVYFRTPTVTFIIRGPLELRSLIECCMPLLENGCTANQLVEIAGRQNIGIVRSLLSILEKKDVIRDFLAAADSVPGHEESAQFADILAYLEAHVADPYEEFRRLRSSAVVVEGPPDASAAAVTGLVDIGIGQVQVQQSLYDTWVEHIGNYPGPIELLRPNSTWPENASGVIAIDDHKEVSTRLSDLVDAGHPLVLIFLSDDIAFVSPVLRSRELLYNFCATWHKVLNWWDTSDLDSATRPLSASLAGSIAAQRFVSDSLKASVISTRQLLIDDIELVSAASTVTNSYADDRELLDALDGTTEESVDATAIMPRIASLFAPWIGIASRSTPDDLPQLPVASAVLSGRTSGLPSSCVGFGPNQAHAELQAALEALRSNTISLYSQPSRHAVSAAGTDTTRWLADGILRGLRNRVPFRDEVLSWSETADLQARRLWRALEDYEGVPFTVQLRTYSWTDWVLVSIRSPEGASLAEQWGDTVGNSLHMALAEAISSHQASSIPGQLDSVHVGGTVILNYLPGSAICTMLRAISCQRLGVLNTMCLTNMQLSCGWVWMV